MSRQRSRGFTLIELLVVIAIIGILAAMVFPVFARARESARKAVCLSNMKNIALAIQMYLADNNDTIWPVEHRQEVIDYVSAQPGGQDYCVGNPESYAFRANPYLRQAVVLDEYVKNRDVWRCPSAKVESGATYILPGPDFLGYLRATEGMWGGSWGFGPCVETWPPGWGGAITDSAVQQTLATDYSFLAEGDTRGTSTALKAFSQSIGVAVPPGTKLAAVERPANTVAVVEAGVDTGSNSPALIAYPDICCAECSGINDGFPPADADYCVGECDGCYEMHANIDWARSEERKKASTRHFGGVNVGFLDGHVTWMNSKAVINAANEGDLDGTEWSCAPYTSREGYAGNCGDPTGSYFLW
jgi:prepilin-type N-terminal cleavage/methylation domain-containing protein/prepilin-type processing-associated H-X9-DG protein